MTEDEARNLFPEQPDRKGEGEYALELGQLSAMFPWVRTAFPHPTALAITVSDAGSFTVAVGDDANECIVEMPCSKKFAMYCELKPQVALKHLDLVLRAFFN